MSAIFNVFNSVGRVVLQWHGGRNGRWLTSCPDDGIEAEGSTIEQALSNTEQAVKKNGKNSLEPLTKHTVG